jgi:hypothetical protein
LKDKKTKILTLPIRIALVILVFGALFKLMHWSYAKELMFFGGILIGTLYSIRFLNKKEKTLLDYVKLSFVFLWLFSYLVQVFHLFSISYIFEICLLILFVWWFFKEGIFYFKNRKFKKNGFAKVLYYIILGLALLSLFFGFIFKIQHWPYGAQLFVSGVLLLNTILILDYFIIERGL